MRLTDLIVNSQGVIRNITTFVRHPGDLLFREARKIVERKVEEVEIPLPGQKTLSSIAPEHRSIASPSSRSIVVRSDASSTKEISSRSKKDLNLGRDLVGRRGRYKISSSFSLTTAQEGKNWRKNIYQGRSSNNNPVIIEEYLFPKLNTKEIEALKKQIDRLETINLRSGGVQDFRIVIPWDFFIDTESKSGYLISQQNPPNRTTLQTHVDQHGAMSSAQVKLFLAQALQSLRFLHQQTIRFADSSTQQGLIHGNLNLDTVLIENALQTVGGLPQFKIYLKELSLWRQHFEQPKLTSKVATSLDCQKDLKDLGKVAASLLMGEPISSDDAKSFNPEKHLPWEDTWSSHPDESLKEFILQILGIKHSITTAEEASRELRQLKEKSPTLAPEAQSTLEPDITAPLWGCGLWFWLAIASLLLPLGLWLYFKQFPSTNPIASLQSSSKTISTVNDTKIQSELNKLTASEYKYMVSPLLSDLVGLKRVSSSQNLQTELEGRDNSKRISKVKLINYLSNWQSKLKSGEVSFILREWDAHLPADFQQKPIAYDGITVFVGSTDPQKRVNANDRDTINLPKKLDGYISIDEIKKIFSGTDRVRDLDFSRYVSNQQQVLYMFKSLVFNTESIQLQGFGTSPPKNSNELIATIFQNAQTYTQGEKIAIGFDRISKVMGQCSVYPLKIQSSSKAVQPIVQDNGTELNPGIDLCHSKGSYWIDETAFQGAEKNASSYPFAYAIAIVYLKKTPQIKDNISRIDQNIQAAEAFHQVVTTDEGQCLLSEAGLVSISTVRKDGICNGGNK